ncbi:serine/threonine protein kinase [Enhygromyxa salina]|uniref:Serine/threonine protein kinase n=1 Tax=Enhygromyxa salina TaxID=215803 RepID=A0A0C2DH89_9BACT|nr:hypothetical protein [Enhygromyxa salina]KIG19052.1 serine/threonine protein kinase [Enhygromyxa salina]
MSDDLLAPGLPPPDPRSSTGSGQGTGPIGPMVAIGALLIAAFGFALFGIGYAAGWWGAASDKPDDEPPAVAKAKPDVAEAPVEPAFAGAELTPEVDPLAGPVEVERDEWELAGLEPVPEIEPRTNGRGGSGGAGSGSADGSGSSANSGAGTRWAGPRVSVTLVLKHYQRVEVKLGGRVLDLDSDKTVKIRPGGYRIELRKTVDAPWQPAGLIEIEEDHSYRVTLLDPPLAKLEIVK